MQTKVQAIDNTNLKTLGGDLTAGFIPSVSIVYDPAAKTVVITDASTIPAGDTLLKVKVRLIDANGKEVTGSITATGTPGALTLSTAQLSPGHGLDVLGTVLTTKGLSADGRITRIDTTGSLEYWRTAKNATV